MFDADYGYGDGHIMDGDLPVEILGDGHDLRYKKISRYVYHGINFSQTQVSVRVTS